MKAENRRISLYGDSYEVFGDDWGALAVLSDPTKHVVETVMARRNVLKVSILVTYISCLQ